MTPKNKAKDLIKKFTITADDSNGMYYMDIATKEKALIAVDEIIKAMDDVLYPNPFKQYWSLVRKEIEKL